MDYHKRPLYLKLTEAGGEVLELSSLGGWVCASSAVPFTRTQTHKHTYSPSPCVLLGLTQFRCLCQIGYRAANIAVGWELPEAMGGHRGVLQQWRSHMSIHVDAADAGGSMRKLQSHGLAVTI